jgi:hypothetical protein
MDRFITQKDEICGECGFELPKGSPCFTDPYDNLRCIDCYEDEMQGEIYG